MNLKEVLQKHFLWLNGDGGERANLEGAHLEGAHLGGANLWRANLDATILHGAKIISAMLGKHQAHYIQGIGLKIGCTQLSIPEWLKQYEKLGNDAGYSEEHIKAYYTFIKFCEQLG